jgi:6-pyruvoyltetrahydropterin/6-carboxytetrahydropterin synthase
MPRTNWTVIADVCGDELNNMGLVMDFNRLKKNLDNIVADFQGKTLETIEYFRKNNSSAENVAKYIYQKLSPKLPKGVGLQAVGVIEEPGCMAKFIG